MSKKLKILVLSDSFPPYHGGGAPIVAYRLSKELANNGHDVLVFSTCQQDNQAGRKDVDGLKVVFHRYNYNLRSRGFRALRNKKLLSILADQINEFQPDVIHAHNIHTYISYASLKLAAKKCSKVFITAHDVDMFHSGKFASFIDKNFLNVPTSFNFKLSPIEKLRQLKHTKNPFRNMIIKYYLGYANKIFAVSNTLKTAINHNGISNVDVVYNATSILKDDSDKNNKGVFEKRFGIKSGQKIIFMANRFGSLKGGNMILPYIKKLKDKTDNFVFVIASQKNNFVKKIISEATNGLANHLIFTGWLNSEELDLLYKNCDMVLVPSLCLDTFNNNNIEAMVHKKPVIGTCFGGTPEVVVDQKTGYIINPLNVEAVTDKIYELLSDGEKVQTFGQAGYERVKKEFSIEKQVADTLKYYE